MTSNEEPEARNSAGVAVKAETDAFLQITAVKGLQFAKHSSHWIESVFWIVLLVGATVLAFRDVRRAWQQFANEETYTSMNVEGLQKLTFNDAIICIGYDPLALHISNPQLAQDAEAPTVLVLAKRANTSRVVLLSRLLKLITAISLTEQGRTADYEKKLAALQQSDDLQQLQDWLIEQRANISVLSNEVGSWLCNLVQVQIVAIKRGHLQQPLNPCKPSKITWLGVIPFASSAISETSVCIDIGGEIAFESMFDRVVVSLNRGNLSTNESGDYKLYSYVDFNGDAVSTSMSNDYVTFPRSGCSAVWIGVGAKVRLIDHFLNPCNATAKTRFRCFADCDVRRYARSRLENCTLLAWRHFDPDSQHMCFDTLSIEAHLDARRMSPRLNAIDLCGSSCLYPCDYRQYNIIINEGGCYEDYADAFRGASIELLPVRFRVPIFQEHFTIDVSALFSSIGGTCGLWLGVGLLGIFHAFLFPFKLLMKIFSERRYKQPNVSAAVELK